MNIAGKSMYQFLVHGFTCDLLKTLTCAADFIKIDCQSSLPIYASPEKLRCEPESAIERPGAPVRCSRAGNSLPVSKRMPLGTRKSNSRCRERRVPKPSVKTSASIPMGKSNTRQEAEMTRYGYARVSTKDQRLDRQIEALVNAGVAYGHIYKDKVTGAQDGDRTQQKRLFKKMRAGDEVVVESWERLTRSTRQLLNYDLMFRNLGVKLTSLKQPVDLDTAFGRFVLGTHACTAELERDLIRQRQAEGIAVKRSHGGNVGGRPRTAGVKADAAVRLYLGGETPIPDICAATGVSKSTLYRILRERGLVGVRK
ncbi:recombinase family protein [Collinsella aerofaciens]